MVSQFAQNEQTMNSVERMLHYTELPAEGDITTPNDPPPTWPMNGKITFSNVEMAYREQVKEFHYFFSMPSFFSQP